MIEFTTLEITLLALCVILFVRGMHHASKAKAMFFLVEAICRDDRVLVELRKHRNAIKERSV
jgi:hypothetical protein